MVEVNSFSGHALGTFALRKAVNSIYNLALGEKSMLRKAVDLGHSSQEPQILD